jgi:hypothetical protein
MFYPSSAYPLNSPFSLLKVTPTIGQLELEGMQKLFASGPHFLYPDSQSSEPIGTVFHFLGVIELSLLAQATLWTESLL